MIPNEQHKHKSIAISAIMNDKKLATIMADALKSNRGSTKRQRAISILRSVRKSSGINDGQGGNPYMNIAPREQSVTGATSMLPQQQPQNVDILSQQPQNLKKIILPSAPAPLKITTPFDITTGRFGGSTISAPTQSPLMTTSKQAVTSPTDIYTPVAHVTPMDKFFEDYKAQNGVLPSVQEIKDFVNNLTAPKVTPTPAPVTPSEVTAPVIPVVQEAASAVVEETPASSTDPEAVQDMVDGGTNKDYDAWYGGLSDVDKTRWKPLYESLSAGVSPKNIAFTMMGNVENFKKAFPDVPDEYIPQGATLAQNYKALEKSIKDKYTVDNLYNNLIETQNSGVNIESSLTDYMTGRDEYISELDRLIDENNTYMSTASDANDPYVKQRMNNYTNYLYLMKGRQQKRYVDYLKLAVDENTQKIANVKALYDSQYKKFTEEFESKKPDIEANYNLFFGMLEDMATNIKDRVKLTDEAYVLHQNAVQEGLNTIKLVADANNTTGLSAAQSKDSQSNYLVAFQDKTTADWDILSNEDKIRWLNTKPSEVVDPDEVMRYAGYIAGKNSEYYDEKTESIKWKALPANYQKAVNDKLVELTAQQANEPSWWDKLWNK